MARTTSPWHRINALDLALCVKFNRVSRYALLCWFFRIVSRLGNGVFWYSLMSVMIVVDGQAALPTVTPHDPVRAGLSGRLQIP